jgi:anti-sigma regulatory factor (Ser/Thr protein kinase)
VSGRHERPVTPAFEVTAFEVTAFRVDDPGDATCGFFGATVQTWGTENRRVLAAVWQAVGDVGCGPTMTGSVAFRHEALMYAGESGFVSGTLPFIRDGLAADEPMLVVVSKDKIDLLRQGLGRDADAVHFADMAGVGNNPARIIPAWYDFVNENPGRRLRGIGEPIWAGRSSAELIECQRHESLLNVAFAEAPAWWLLCPYDTDSLDPDVIAEARRSHPFVAHECTHSESLDYRGLDRSGEPFDAPLPEAPVDCPEIEFGAGPMQPVRAFVAQHAGTDLGAERVADLILAVTEVATNSVRYGGGHGAMRIWRDDSAVICEVRDHGHLEYPLVGRRRPAIDTVEGRGIWLVHQLCDLVQIRSYASGTVVRMHTWIR